MYVPFAPLTYFSERGVHSFSFPVAFRNIETGEFREINPMEFTELVAANSLGEYPDMDAVPTQKRMENSIENLALYLEHYKNSDQTANNPEQTFIEAEQSLILGHSVHPLPKSRE